MPAGKRHRKVLFAAMLMLAVLFFLIAALPLWLPWLLPLPAQKLGIHYSRYERDGYGRFVLHDVAFTNRAVRFHAEQVHGLVPHVWLWRCAVRLDRRPFLEVNRWQVEFLQTPKRGNSGSISSVYKETMASTKLLRTLQRWLPTAAASQGELRFEKTVMTLPGANWARGHLSAKIEWPRYKQNASIVANLSGSVPYEVKLRSESLALESTIHVFTNQTGLTLQSTNLWLSNRVRFAAQFASTGVLPQIATLEAPGFRLPGTLLQLPGYRELTGSLQARWDSGAFSVDLTAEGRPESSETNFPPAKLDLHADGNTNSTTIRSAVITSPWLHAEISRNLTLHFTGPLLRDPARFRVAVDLRRQPWVALQGSLNGDAEFIPTAGTLPDARFHFGGSNVGNAEVNANTVSLDGNFSWPRLEITKAAAVFEDASTLSASGMLDITAKAFERAQLEFQGPLFQRWLPADYGYEKLLLRADLHGPFNALVHSGRLEVTNLSIPSFKPSTLQVSWSGTRKYLERAQVSSAVGGSILSATFSGGIEDAKTNMAVLNLDTLQLRQKGQSMLELEKPAHLEIALAARSTNGFEARLDDFHWRGRGGEIKLESLLNWPQSGTLQAQAANLHSTLAADFLAQNPGEFELRKLVTDAAWTNGPMLFEVQLSGSGTPVMGPEKGSSARPAGARTNSPASILAEPLFAEISLRGDLNGVAISNFVIMTQTSSVAVARGFLPLTLNPAIPTNLVHLDMTKSLDLILTTEPQAVFWSKLADWSGLNLGQPKLRASVSGTWAAPQGQVELQAHRIQYAKARAKLPVVENLQLVLKLERELARLTNCQFVVEGQPVKLSAEMPLEEKFWRSLEQKKLPDWQRATARLEMKDADLAAFAPLFPKILSPQGTLNLNLLLRPGVNVEGSLVVKGAGLHPLPSIGAIRDIAVDAEFRDRRLALKSASAFIGGAPIKITGRADLRGSEWLEGALPPFEFQVRGTNVPLARQPESIIRSDLNLAFLKTNALPPLITGSARLTNSFFLSDVTDLIPGRVATARRRPPYFSVDSPPLADWRLAVQVEGAHFLRVRSTIFNGQVSANLRLQGTLKDPIALGDLKIDSGLVRFPFASLQVQQGFVTLTAEDPYRPRISVNATSKQYGYDVRMEVTGTADAPVIQFSSTPPLSSEQILLMVTAGELPTGNFTLSSQQKAQTFAVFLGRDLLSKLGFGDQTEERLTVHSGEQISETGRPTYNAEYKLSDRWSVVGEYDRFGDFNAGVKWRIYSK